MGDSLPPKKLWLRRKPVASTQQPPLTSNNPHVRDRESSHGPEAAVSRPGGTAPALQTPERSRTTDSDVTLPPSPREHSPGALDTGCFEAMRNALRCSVIKFVAPRRKRRRAVHEPSSAPRNESPTGSDDKSNRGTRRRSFDPESSGDSGSGCSPRKRALSAVPNAESERVKTTLQWADLEEPTMSGFAEVYRERDPDTWTPSEQNWASEDTVAYPGDVFEKPSEPSFSRVLTEAFKSPEPVESSSASASRPVVDVDRLLMPPPPVPWVKVARQKMRQLASDSTSQTPSSSLFSADHFRNSFSEGSQSSASSQSSPSKAGTSKAARPRTLSLGNAHQEQGISGKARRRSYSWCSEGQNLRQDVWGEPRKGLDPSNKVDSRSPGAYRKRQFDPLSNARRTLSDGDVPLNEYQESEHHASCPDIGKLSLESPREAGSFRERRYRHRLRKESVSFQKNLTQRSILHGVSAPNIAVTQDADRRECPKGAAPQGPTSEDRRDLGWKGGAPGDQDGSSKQTAIDVDDTSIPAAFETLDRRLPRPPVGIHLPETRSLHHDTAANLAEAAMRPAAPAATVWVPTKIASSVTATDFAMASQTPIDAKALNVPATPVTQQHGTAADVTGMAMSTAEPWTTTPVPTKTASSTTTTDFPTMSHPSVTW